MTQTTEPPNKKAKMAEITSIDSLINSITNSKENLRAILDDKLFKPVPLIGAYIGHVKDPKDISKIFQVFNEKVPLKDFQHLKRARKRDFLLCPTNFLGQGSINDFLERNAEECKDSFQYFKEVEVPLIPPLVRKQYMECSKYWSVNFHPDKDLERLVSTNVFKCHEICDHRFFMGIAFEVAKWYQAGKTFDEEDIKLGNVNAAIVVDPIIRSVVAVAFDNRRDHPVQHSAMLLIDNVAKTQDGGAWKLGDTRTGILAGIDKDLLMHLKDKFRFTNFGSKPFCSKRVNPEKSEGSPYLCTGYDIYLLREPCLMCSMGLVHARVKRVFFCFDNTSNGALKSITKLQCVDSLNHHFEVFSGFI